MSNSSDVPYAKFEIGPRAYKAPIALVALMTATAEYLSVKIKDAAEVEDDVPIIEDTSEAEGLTITTLYLKGLGMSQDCAALLTECRSTEEAFALPEVRRIMARLGQ